MAKRCQLPRMSPQKKKKTENFNPPTRFTPKSCIKQRAENPPPLSDFNDMLSRHALFFPFFIRWFSLPLFRECAPVKSRGWGKSLLSMWWDEAGVRGFTFIYCLTISRGLFVLRTHPEARRKPDCVAR